MPVLCYNTKHRHGVRSGQALLEYVLSLASLLLIVGILWGLVQVTIRHAERAEALVTSECP